MINREYWANHPEKYERWKENLRRKKVTPAQLRGLALGRCKGQVRSYETRMKMSASRIGVPHSGGFKKGHEPWNKGKRYYAIMGENNPNWKGGVIKLNRALRQTINFENWRNAVFERDNYICRKCFKKGTLHSHHITAFSRILRENNIKSVEDAFNCAKLWDINNGITLCLDCHGSMEGRKYYRRYNHKKSSCDKEDSYDKKDKVQTSLARWTK